MHLNNQAQHVYVVSNAVSYTQNNTLSHFTNDVPQGSFPSGVFYEVALEMIGFNTKGLPADKTHVAVECEELRQLIRGEQYDKSLRIVAVESTKKGHNKFVYHEFKNRIYCILSSRDINRLTLRLTDLGGEQLKLAAGQTTIARLSIRKAMSNSNFMVRIQSNADQGSHDEFISKLPRTLELPGKWNVNLASITYPAAKSTVPIHASYEALFVKVNTKRRRKKKIPMFAREGTPYSQVIIEMLEVMYKVQTHRCVGYGCRGKRYPAGLTATFMGETMHLRSNRPIRIGGDIGDLKFLGFNPIVEGKTEFILSSYMLQKIPVPWDKAPTGRVLKLWYDAEYREYPVAIPSEIPASANVSAAADFFNAMGNALNSAIPNGSVSFIRTSQRNDAHAQTLSHIDKDLDSLFLFTRQPWVVTYLQISIPLAELLGFNMAGTADNTVFTQAIDLRMPLYKNPYVTPSRANVAFVYADIIKPVLIGGHYAPILRAFDVTDQDAGFVTQEFSHPDLVRVSNEVINNIEIKIAGPDGAALRFEDNAAPVLLTLQFEKINE